MIRLLSPRLLTQFPSRSVSAVAQPPPCLSTTYRGTEFEKRSLKILTDNMSMSLRRIGGKSDGGIDLLGWWWLPPTPDDTDPSTGPLTSADDQPQRRRLRILGQCKAEKQKTGPKYIREMEGVLHRYMSLSQSDLDSPARPLGAPHDIIPPQCPLVALFISESPFTKAAILRAQSSPVPFFLLHIPPVDGDEPQAQGQIGTAVWNPALAGLRGLLRGQVEARWERTLTGGGRPGLWWRGERLKSWTPDSYTDG